MWHFFNSIFDKVISAVATAIIAVGIVSVPEPVITQDIQNIQTNQVAEIAQVALEENQQTNETDNLIISSTPSPVPQKTVNSQIENKENYVSTAVNFLDAVISNYSEDKESARESISIIKDTKQSLTESKYGFMRLRDSVSTNTAEGQKTVDIFNLFINDYEKEIVYYEELIKYLNDTISIIDNNTNLAIKHKVSISSLYFTKEQANSEAEKIYNGEYKIELSIHDAISKTWGNFYEYSEKKQSERENALTYLKNYYSVSPYSSSQLQSLSPVIITKPQFPTHTYCTYQSYITGQGILNCIEMQY